MEATPRPWSLGFHDRDLAFINSGKSVVAKCDSQQRDHRINATANAELICAAVNAYHPERDKLLQEAVDEIRRLQGYLLNAAISLDTNAPRKTARATIEGGIQRSRDFLSKLKETPAAPPPQEDK